MDLREFVKKSLVEIIGGVSEAIKESHALGNRAIINPTGSNQEYSTPKEIVFDVAVTVQEDVSANGSAGISVWGAKIGGEAEKTLSNTAVSRLSFSVPVAWPSVAKDQYLNLPVSRSQGNYNPFDFEK